MEVCHLLGRIVLLEHSIGCRIREKQLSLRHSLKRESHFDCGIKNLRKMAALENLPRALQMLGGARRKRGSVVEDGSVREVEAPEQQTRNVHHEYEQEADNAFEESLHPRFSSRTSCAYSMGAFAQEHCLPRLHFSQSALRFSMVVFPPFNTGLQPRRLMITPAADGCKPMLGGLIFADVTATECVYTLSR